MKNFPDQEFPENGLTKEQLKYLRNKVIEINLINKDDNLINMTFEDGLVIFEIDDNDNINSYEFSDFKKADDFLTSRHEIASRFDDWKKDNKEKYEAAVKHTVTVATIKSLISSLNYHNVDQVQYSYLYEGDNKGGGKIQIIENTDKIIVFDNLKELNKWVLAQLGRVNIVDKNMIQNKINTITDVFNSKNKEKNVAIEIWLEKDNSVTITFLNAITHKVVASDVKLPSIGKLFDWAEKQKLI